MGALCGALFLLSRPVDGYLCVRMFIAPRVFSFSRKKTEYLGCNEYKDAEIQLQGNTVKRMQTFKYLGSTLAGDGEVTHRLRGALCMKKVDGTAREEEERKALDK